MQTGKMALIDRLRGREWFRIGNKPFFRQGAVLCMIILFSVACLTPLLRDVLGTLPAFFILGIAVYFAGMLLVKITLASGHEI